MNLKLIASNIFKGYNGNAVLHDCSYSFEESGIYVLTGPNGCGKSTFLRICALIEQPDSGDINFISAGKQTPKDLALKRRITLVLPKVGIFNTTVVKNAAYGLAIRGIKGQEAKERVDKVLDFVGLAHKKEQNALTVSSGEAQRLGIARALVIEPEILFLDEPTASVDQKNTAIIEDIVKKMKQERSVTVIMTTHDKEQASRLSDRLLVMKDGAILSTVGR
ncbi:MAG TPA: ATP-binding cassette domain-containing protein [Dissulfurispiraceae bacterium]|nr:ATP-binding cassette domain-containing protein [Dissulfurispiraceae bacterium]